jgi:hypothetical protein
MADGSAVVIQVGRQVSSGYPTKTPLVDAWHISPIIEIGVERLKPQDAVY